MRDMHSHILPGVDDGARDLEMSLAMIDAARRAGVTSIVCTPHARDPYFDYESMWSAYHELCRHTNMPLSMGFEVAHQKLMELTQSFRELDRASETLFSRWEELSTEIEQHEARFRAEDEAAAE